MDEASRFRLIIVAVTLEQHGPLNTHSFRVQMLPYPFGNFPLHNKKRQQWIPLVQTFHPRVSQELPHHLSLWHLLRQSSRLILGVNLHALGVLPVKSRHSHGWLPLILNLGILLGFLIDVKSLKYPYRQRLYSRFL